LHSVQKHKRWAKATDESLILDSKVSAYLAVDQCLS